MPHHHFAAFASGDRFQRQNEEERRIAGNGAVDFWTVAFCRRDHDDPRFSELHAGRSDVEAGNHLP